MLRSENLEREVDAVEVGDERPMRERSMMGRLYLVWNVVSYVRDCYRRACNQS